MAAVESEGSLMPDTRQYELVYLVSPEVGEDGVGALHTQVDEIVTGLGGRIENTDNWGRRRLAYEIGKHKDGTYVVELVDGPPELVQELDRRLKVMDTVLRHLVVRVDEDLKKARRARERRQTRQTKRRAARGLVPADPAADATGAEDTATATSDAQPASPSKQTEVSE